MALVRLTFDVEAPDDGDFAVLGDRVANFIKEQEDLALRGWGQVGLEDTYTVFGVVKGKPDETWHEVLTATDKDHAAKKATSGKGKTNRTVAVVLDGDHAPDEPTDEPA